MKARTSMTIKTRIALSLAVLAISTSIVAADEFVNGYYRSNGTYVQPHHRTAPDHSTINNYGTQGNANPYTGQQGHVNPYAPSYPQPAPYLYNPYGR